MRPEEVRQGKVATQQSVGERLRAAEPLESGGGRLIGTSAPHLP
jgi:hypothetical protein